MRAAVKVDMDGQAEPPADAKDAFGTYTYAVSSSMIDDAKYSAGKYLL